MVIKFFSKIFQQFLANISLSQHSTRPLVKILVTLICRKSRTGGCLTSWLTHLARGAVTLASP